MKYQYWIYATWLSFVVRYRKTLLGPLWLMVGPILFILTIGMLYSRINQADATQFVPHLAIGVIIWTLIVGFVTGSTTIFQRYRSQIIQGELQLMDITMVGVFTTVLQFLHQVIIILIVLIYYKIPINAYTIVSFLGLALLIINGVWLSIVFGIIGARYHDLNEVIQAIMRIAFLATPIVWLPGGAGYGGVMGKFLMYNPFYHYLELIRAPLLQTSISPLSWYVVLTFTVVGCSLAFLFKAKFSRVLALWV